MQEEIARLLVDGNLQVNLKSGDIEIGAVEIKDGATDTRATVDAANTARTTATNVIPTQPIDAGGFGQTNAYTPNYISTLAATIVSSVPGVLAAVTVGETAAGAITFYDNASGASGTTIGVLKADIAEGTYVFLGKFANGLTVDTAAASKITVLTV